MTKYRLKTKKSGKNNGALKEMCKEIEQGGVTEPDCMAL